MKTKTTVMMIAVLVAVSAISFYSGIIYQQTQTPGIDHVTMSLEWVAGGYGGMVPWYGILDNDFFENEGLSVEYLSSGGSMDAITRLASGAVDFAIADTSEVARMAAKGGLDIKMLAVMVKEPNISIRFIKGRNIETPEDLEGAKHADGEPEPGWEMKAFAYGAGIDITKVDHIYVSGELTRTALIVGEIDFSAYSAVGLPSFIIDVEAAGLEPGYFLAADYGVSLYSHGLVTTDEMINENPDIVRRFVTAFVKGLSWCLEHPVETVDSFMKYYPTTNRESFTQSWRAMIDLMFDAGDLERGIMVISPQRITDTVNLVNAMEGVNLDPEKIYTTEFTEGLSDEVLHPVPPEGWPST